MAPERHRERVLAQLAEAVAAREAAVRTRTRMELAQEVLARRPPFSIVDLWVVRVLGTVAAACFILLLISILRVFV